MKINFKENIAELNYFLLFNILGIVTAMKNDLINTETAEVCFFNPYTLENLKKNGIKKEISDIIESCLELNDIERIVSVEERNNEIENIIKKVFKQLEILPNLNYPIIRNIEE